MRTINEEKEAFNSQKGFFVYIINEILMIKYYVHLQLDYPPVIEQFFS